LRELCRLTNETEWVEFKGDNDDAPMIGEYISALANSAALLGKQSGYVVWGVDDETMSVAGTTFKPSTTKYKQQELESWLLQKRHRKLIFVFTNLNVAILDIQAATHTPVQFNGTENSTADEVLIPLILN
jgi:predicted HTH transcriptional regulator